MILALKEQKALLQCLWQVMAANPTPIESDFIEQQLCYNWDCLKNVDMSDALFLRFELGCEIKPWIVIAVQQDPYASFSIIQELPLDKKIFVKELVLKLLEIGNKYNERAPYAHTLFENCEIPFVVKGALFPDGHFGNKLM